MSKKVKRDEQGHAILDGARTFGSYTAKALGGKRQPRGHILRDQAAERLLNLIMKGPSIDSFMREAPPITNSADRKALRDQNEFAQLPLVAKFAYYHGMLMDLRKELSELEASGNQRKIDFTKPVILMQIEDTETRMTEMYLEIRSQKRVISVGSSEEE